MQVDITDIDVVSLTSGNYHPIDEQTIFQIGVCPESDTSVI